MKKLILVFVIIFVAVAAVLERGRIRDAVSDLTRPPVPSAMPYASVTMLPSASPSTLPSQTTLPSVTPRQTVVTAPAAVNLDIPFVSQAPHKIWDEDHEEFCEEAAALMAASYIHGDRSVTNIDVAEAELQRIKTWEMQTFGYFKDTTAAETARIVREHFGIADVQVVYDPTEKDIKAWVADGKAVLVPAAGRELGNPNFKSPGPIYHFVVIKGYTANGTFITNDAGTRKGADYLYSPAVIMNAMHDWNGGDVIHGRKVVVVVG